MINLKNDIRYYKVINEFEQVFSRFGKPDILYTDNGPQFINYEFQKFLKNWEIMHKTSSPRYPQSNGFIERHVQTIKKMFQKNLFDGKNLNMTLLEYRNTPISADVASPAALLLGRKLKGILPIKSSLLQTNHEVNKEVRKFQRHL